MSYCAYSGRTCLPSTGQPLAMQSRHCPLALARPPLPPRLLSLNTPGAPHHSQPSTPSSRSLLPTSSSLHSPSISIHNAWRASHTITTYYRCPYSPQPAQQAAALRKGKKKKSLFSVERASLRRKLNQPTKYTTIIQPKPRNKKLSETSSFHHKEQFSQSPTGRHICDAGISVPSLPACQPLQNVSIFRAWAAGSSQQHFPFPHNPHDSGIRAETTPTLNPGALPTEGLGQGLEMQS